MDIAVLGATGSIGTQTLDVVRNCLPDVRIRALTGYANLDKLAELTRFFKPDIISVPDDRSAQAIKGQIPNSTEVVTGQEGINTCATLPGVQTVVNALTGGAGLIPTLCAIEAGKDIALANKETLVTAGALVMRMARERNVRITPVDSEHSAIWQCLQGNEGNRVEKIILTASGGAFRNRSRDFIKEAKAFEALQHPTWLMGSKITIDCATMMNKGLEVIEAMWLFGVDAEQIEVLVHPQSIVHSMVVFEDGAVMAQMGAPDMRVPIQYALTGPKRFPNTFPKLNLLNQTLTFSEPNTDTFPCLLLAEQAARVGGTLPAVMNTLNEAAVKLYLQDRIGFYDISRLITDAFASYTVKPIECIEDIREAEQWAADFMRGESSFPLLSHY